MAARELFPLSGRHRHFRRRAFFNEPQPNSPRREHPWAFPYLLPSLTGALFLSRLLPPVTLSAPPLDVVAVLLRPRSSIAVTSIELLDLQVCSSTL